MPRIAFLLSFLLVLLPLTVSARRAEVSITPKDAEAFFLGVLQGLEEDYAGNITTCLSDEQAAITQFQAALANLEKGIARKSVSLLELAFQQFGVALQDTAAALKDCNVEGAVADLEKLGELLASGEGGIIEVVIKELVGFWTRRREVTTDIKALMTAWKQGAYGPAGVAVGKLVGILLQDAKRR